jgi:hypothetical protein
VTLLVDYQILAAHLRGRRVLPRADEPVFTTGYWYVLLCLAVTRRAGGTLSGPFAALPEHQRHLAVSAVLRLPPEIGLLSLRQLGPLMGELAHLGLATDLRRGELLALRWSDIEQAGVPRITPNGLRRFVRDVVEISSGGEIIRTHPIPQDRSCEHGAFANPGGRPHRINAA